MKNTFGSALALTIFGESHGRAIGGVLDGMAAGAVSYTHLRAHETDSHLVCRLLLEKKKKSQTDTQVSDRKGKNDTPAREPKIKTCN